jgi:hypothetical protein
MVDSQKGGGSVTGRLGFEPPGPASFFMNAHPRSLQGLQVASSKVPRPGLLVKCGRGQLEEFTQGQGSARRLESTERNGQETLNGCWVTVGRECSHRTFNPYFILRSKGF